MVNSIQTPFNCRRRSNARRILHEKDLNNPEKLHYSPAEISWRDRDFNYLYRALSVFKGILNSINHFTPAWSKFTNDFDVMKSISSKEFWRKVKAPKIFCNIFFSLNFSPDTHEIVLTVFQSMLFYARSFATQLAIHSKYTTQHIKFNSRTQVSHNRTRQRLNFKCVKICTRIWN